MTIQELRLEEPQLIHLFTCVILTLLGENRNLIKIPKNVWELVAPGEKDKVGITSLGYNLESATYDFKFNKLKL